MLNKMLTTAFIAFIDDIWNEKIITWKGNMMKNSKYYFIIKLHFAAAVTTITDVCGVWCYQRIKIQIWYYHLQTQYPTQYDEI